MASSFESWDRHSAVRSKASPIFPATEPSGFPAEFVPILRHPAILRLPEQQSRHLRRAALFRFLNFTHKLELLVVNTVTANIALGRYDFVLSPSVRRNAHRIYVDDGYHALFSYDHMQGLVRHLPPDMAVERKPQFLITLERMKKDLKKRQVLLLELFFVIFSEMLITNTLKSAHARSDIDSGIRDALAQHAFDEARHHVFYKSLLQDIWPQLSKGDQDFALGIAPSLLIAYCSPDMTAMEAELVSSGFSKADAQLMLAETYPQRSTARYAQDVGKGVLSILASMSSPRQHDILAETADREMLNLTFPSTKEDIHV